MDPPYSDDNASQIYSSPDASAYETPSGAVSSESLNRGPPPRYGDVYGATANGQEATAAGGGGRPRKKKKKKRRVVEGEGEDPQPREELPGYQEAIERRDRYRARNREHDSRERSMSMDQFEPSPQYTPTAEDRGSPASSSATQPRPPPRSSSVEVMERMSVGRLQPADSSRHHPQWLETMQRVSQSSLDTSPDASMQHHSAPEHVLPVMAIEMSDLGSRNGNTQPDTQTTRLDRSNGSEMSEILRRSVPVLRSIENVESAEDDDKETWGEWFGRKRTIIIVFGVIALLFLILFFSLFSSSFVTLEYYHLALKRTTSTRVVDKENTYYPGCYILGPNAEFVTFPKTAQTLTMDLSVYTMERLSVGFSVSMQYFLRPEEIGEMYGLMGNGYADILEKLVEAALKNRMIFFSLDFLRNDRAELEIELHRTAHRKLAGTCCLGCCSMGTCHGRQIHLCTGCINNSDTCSSGYHAEVLYFQLGDLTMPTRVSDRILNQLVLKVQTETEQFIQDKTIAEIVTEQMVQQIQNEANELAANATAHSALLAAEADAGAVKERETATTVSLQEAYRRLSLTKQDHKLSYYWIHTLKNVDLVRAAGVGAWEEKYMYTGTQ